MPASESGASLSKLRSQDLAQRKQHKSVCGATAECSAAHSGVARGSTMRMQSDDFDHGAVGRMEDRAVPMKTASERRLKINCNGKQSKAGNT
jgi:hypothetical protein